MYYSFIHLPLPFNCQFHSQLEKSTIFLTLQIISHFSSPLVLSRKYQQHLPASIHNLIHIPSNYPITHVDRPDHFSSSGTTSLHPPPSSSSLQNRAKQPKSSQEGRHVVVGTADTIVPEFPVLPCPS